MKAAGAVAVLGLGYLALRQRQRGAPPPAVGDVEDLELAPLVPQGTVLHRERLVGVHPDLLELVDWWPGAPGRSRLLIIGDGGKRVDETLQARLYAEGNSKARTLRDTPHGRGAAVDAYAMPDGATAVDWNDTAGFRAWGLYAEGIGFTWGGRWTSFPDLAHVEIADWRTLPFPGDYR